MSNSPTPGSPEAVKVLWEKEFGNASAQILLDDERWVFRTRPEGGAEWHIAYGDDVEMIKDHALADLITAVASERERILNEIEAIRVSAYDGSLDFNAGFDEALDAVLKLLEGGK